MTCPGSLFIPLPWGLIMNLIFFITIVPAFMCYERRVHDFPAEHFRNRQWPRGGGYPCE